MKNFSFKEMGGYTNLDGRSIEEITQYLLEKEFIERSEKEIKEENSIDK